MDETRFDALTKSLTAGHSRRGITRLLGSLALVGALLPWLDTAESEAKKKRQKKRKKKKRQKKGCNCSGCATCVDGTCVDLSPLCDANACQAPECNAATGTWTCVDGCAEIGGECCDGKCVNPGQCSPSTCRPDQIPCVRHDGRLFCCRHDMICCGDAMASCVFDASNCPG